MKRLNLDLSEDLHTRFKVVCTLDGKQMSEVVRKLIAEYVEKGEKQLRLKR